MNIIDSCQENAYNDDESLFHDDGDDNKEEALSDSTPSVLSEIDISMTLELMMNKKYHKKGLNQKSSINKLSGITENVSLRIIEITNDVLGKSMSNHRTDKYCNDLTLAFKNYVSTCLDHIANN